MFYVMVEIANYRQLARLSSDLVDEIHEMLRNVGLNRGAKLVKDQNGYFLFSFHPQREKILHLISDFLFLTRESLGKKAESLFGFNLLLEESDDGEDLVIFNRLKSLLFLTTTENTVWAGPGIQSQLDGLFPLQGEGELKEICGPVHKPGFVPLEFQDLLEVSGWTSPLKTFLKEELEAGRTSGRLTRLQGDLGVEKLILLKKVLQDLYQSAEDFPLIFPFSGSADFLTQLLGQVSTEFLSEIRLYLLPEEIQDWLAQPQWQFLLESRGGSDYPGDRCGTDAVQALGYYYRAQIRRLQGLGLPPVFLFLTPAGFQPPAFSLLVQIFAPLVDQEKLQVIVLEPTDSQPVFLADMPGRVWSFPGINFSSVQENLQGKGWADRFPQLASADVEGCRGSASALAHLLWGVQEERLSLPLAPDTDVSWSLLLSLDGSHQKVLYVFLLGQVPLTESDLVEFFHFMGEDQAVVHDKIQNLKALGFMIFGVSNLSLHDHYRERLAVLLQQEGENLRSRLADFYFARWKNQKSCSEILIPLLLDSGKFTQALLVLSHYVTYKINRGEGDWMTWVRPGLVSRFPLELRDGVIQMVAAFKLRFALNMKNRFWKPGDLNRIKKYFTGKTELKGQGEWYLQLGRFHLYHGDGTLGFQLLKKALMAAQETQDSLLEIRANTEIGQTLIMKHRLEEGQEYFEMAGKQAEKLGILYNRVLAGGLDAVCRFLFGNLHTTRKLIEGLLPAATKAGMGQWVQFFSFLQARIDIDCGQYESALGFLALAGKEGRGSTPSGAVMELWRGRCLHFLGQREEARRVLEACPEGMERNYYLAELEAGEKNLNRASLLLTRALTMNGMHIPFTGETLVWDTGYSNMEDKVLEKNSDRGVLYQQIEAYSLYLLSQLNPAESQVTRFQTLLAEKTLLEANPFSHQIYFWFFLSLSPQDPSVEALRLTLLGRALKDLQIRGSRIEEPQLRHNYLHRVPWNAQMMSEARRYKLL